MEDSLKKIFCNLLVILLLSALSNTFSQIDDTPDNPNERAPAPEGVQPVIPLNVDDPTYDLWKLVRDDLSEGREPGPIDIQRFYGGTGWMGIPTFFRLPVALVPEDLKAGQVDVAIMGAYNDMGFGSRGANRGPAAFREGRGEYVTHLQSLQL
jgi:agmatinase